MCLLGRGRRGRTRRSRAGCRARGCGRRGAPRGGPSARASAAATDGDRAWNRPSTSLRSRLSPAPPTRSFSPMNATVGLVVGREWSFPPKLIEEVNGRDRGVVAEYAKLGAERMDAPSAYAVIIDRISHEVPFYRTYLKHAVLQGVAVVNNPFMWSADDKFFGATLATRLGVASPKTVVLPNKEYIPGISHEESLRNLVFPLDWDAVRVLEYAGKPDVPQHRVPVEREHQVAEALLVTDPRDVLLVRQHDGLRARDPEPGRERRAEELVIGAPHEGVVDDRHALEHGVLQVRAVKWDLVRDTVDDDGVGARRIHTLGAEFGVLGDHAAIATVHFLDRLWWERPLTTDAAAHW